MLGRRSETGLALCTDLTWAINCRTLFLAVQPALAVTAWPSGFLAVRPPGGHRLVVRPSLSELLAAPAWPSGLLAATSHNQSNH